jgi:hypothetical protein
MRLWLDIKLNIRELRREDVDCLELNHNRMLWQGIS